MPPQVKFSRDDILKAAFDLISREGLASITAQGIAGKLNSSVQPLYSNFTGVMELKETLARISSKLFRTFVVRSYLDIPYLDVFIGELLFSRNNKNLYVSFLIERNDFEDAFLKINHEQFDIFKIDPRLKGLSHDQLHALYRHMQIYTYGLCVMICNDYWTDQTNIGMIRALQEFAEVTLAAVRDNRILGRSKWFAQPEISLELPQSDSALSMLAEDAGS